MRRAAGALFSIAVGLAGAPGAAAAAPEIPVVVVPVRSPAIPAEAGVVWSTRRAVDAHPDLRAVDVVGALSSGAGAAADRERARAALEAARDAYAGLDLDRALAAAEQAVRLLRRGAPDARDEVVAALLILARAHLAADDRDAAISALRRALVVDPELTLDRRREPPSLLRALAAARAPVEGGTGRLRVDAVGAPAAVFLDGHLAGVTPCYLDAVPAGPHDLVVAADGFRRDVRLIDVRPGAGQAIRVKLEPAPRASLLDEITADLPGLVERDAAGAPLRELKALFVAEQAILIEAGEDEIRAALFDLAAGRRARAVTVPFEPETAPGPAIVRALYEGLDPRAPALATLPPAGAPPEPEPEALHRRWWFWPAVGAAAATAVAIPVLLLTGDDGGAGRRDGGVVLLTF